MGRINTFNGGIDNDVRSSDFSRSQLVKHFDNFTYPHKLVPFRESEDGDSLATTNQIQNFVTAIRTGTTVSLYGLGWTGQFSKVFYKDLSTGGSNDLSDANWTGTANNASASGAANFKLFVYYNRTAKIYGTRASRYIWAYDPTGSAGWTETSKDLADYSDVFSSTFTNNAQGLVHSKDDILYIPIDNYIVKNDNGTWGSGTAPALKLPTDMIITSICEYGNYLAIGCRSSSDMKVSKVYLWDRDTSLSTLSESADFPADLYGLGTVGGSLVGISVYGAKTYNLQRKLIFSQYVGGRSEVFKEISFGASTTMVFSGLQKVGDRLYFGIQGDDKDGLTTNGYTGIWSIGRNAIIEPIQVAFSYVPNNNTVATLINNFIFINDFVLISYKDGSGNFALSKTIFNNAVYSVNSTYESLKINLDDIRITKKLVGVTVETEALPTAGQVVLKYRKDEETSWTTIFTNTTDNSLSHSSVNIESSGANLPQFKEIQFQILSTGNAVITGLRFKVEIIDKEPY